MSKKNRNFAFVFSNRHCKITKKNRNMQIFYEKNAKKMHFLRKMAIFHEFFTKIYMEQEEIHARIMDLYREAVTTKKCSSKGEFAALVGVSKQTISSAMNKKPLYLTDRLLAKCEAAVHPAVTISMENSGDAHGNTQKNFGPLEEIQNKDVCEIVQTLTDELRAERESHERIMLALIEKIGQK